MGNTRIPSLATDYIVEKGTIDIWNYRKWSSGRIEMWGVYATIMNTWDTTYGNFYYKTIGSIAFPSGLLTADPVVVASGRWGGGYCTITVPSATSTTFSLYISTTVIGDAAVIVNLYVNGKWK